MSVDHDSHRIEAPGGGARPGDHPPTEVTGSVASGEQLPGRADPGATRAYAPQVSSAPSHHHGSRVAARDHCLSLVRAVDRPTGAARYGRMFPDLEPLGTDPQLLMRAAPTAGSATPPRSWIAEP
jgi:hypothetical protein